MKGGYINIDCTGLDLTKGSTQQTITGIYNTVKNAMNANKPMFAYNAKWGNTKIVTPISVFAIQEDSTTIIVTSSTLQIVIKNTDKVTINNMAPAN